MTWKGGFDRGFTPAEFSTYVAGLQWTAWRPQFVTVHNTGAPSLAQWRATPVPGKVNPTMEEREQQRLKNLEHYYRNQQKWSSGPHLFVGEKIWLGTPLTVSGTHSPSWNSIALGMEIAGDYDKDAFEDPIRSNAIHALAELHKALGLSPDTTRFHKEDPKTTHKRCPGKNIDKNELVSAVKAKIVSANAGDHPVEEEGAEEAPQGLVHTVSKGDTLWAIAKRYGIAVAVLLAQNGGSPDIKIGQLIQIGDEAGEPEPAPVVRRPVSELSFSREGDVMTIQEEAMVLTVYMDGNVPAAGAGHNDASLKFGDRITLEQGLEFFKQDRAIVAQAMAKIITVPLTQAEYDAYGDFSYNLGIGSLARSSLLKKLNAGDYDGAKDGLRVWNKAGGKVSDGLVRRRAREIRLIETGDYGSVETIPVYEVYPGPVKRLPLPS